MERKREWKHKKKENTDVKCQNKRKEKFKTDASHSKK